MPRLIYLICICIRRTLAEYMGIRFAKFLSIFYLPPKRMYMYQCKQDEYGSDTWVGNDAGTFRIWYKRMPRQAQALEFAQADTGLRIKWMYLSTFENCTCMFHM